MVIDNEFAYLFQPKKLKNNHVFGMCISKKQREKIIKVSNDNCCSQSEVVRRCIDKQLKLDQ